MEAKRAPQYAKPAMEGFLMGTMTEYVRRSDEIIVDGKLDVYFEDSELFAWARDQQKFATGLAPRTDTAVGRFMDWRRGQGSNLRIPKDSAP